MRKFTDNEVLELPSFSMPNGNVARMFRLEYKAYGGYWEEIAYLRYKDGIHFIVLRTQDLQQCKDLEPKLFEALNNLQFMDKVDQ